MRRFPRITPAATNRTSTAAMARSEYLRLPRHSRTKATSRTRPTHRPFIGWISGSLTKQPDHLARTAAGSRKHSPATLTLTLAARTPALPLLIVLATRAPIGPSLAGPG